MLDPLTTEVPVRTISSRARHTKTAAVLGAALLILAGCGISMQPRIEGFGAPGGAFPQPPATPERTSAGEVAARQVCRGSRPSGWIAVRYVADEDCASSADEENPYTGAVIRKYRTLPLGSRLTVCADQGVPRGWVREYAGPSAGHCPGARVDEGAATVYVMRRVR
jgi:hypothetical protein